MMQLFAPPLDRSFVREFAQHLFEQRTIGILQIEGARNLAGADLSGLGANEGDHLLLGRKGL
jgi:hypothetical protein